MNVYNTKLQTQYQEPCMPRISSLAQSLLIKNLDSGDTWAFTISWVGNRIDENFKFQSS